MTLLSDDSVVGGVTFAFTERTGGVSEGPYASLNLGDSCGDDPAAVAENRRRALAALGLEGLEHRLVNPRQVHGSHVVIVRGSSERDVSDAQREARAGSDAVVCTAHDVPVLLCYADCVPIVLCAEGGFAVVHSGWRGTLARISAKALSLLCAEACVGADEVSAYIGPHIMGPDYEVSPELLDQFRGEFGDAVCLPHNHLDLTAAVRLTLLERGISPDNLAICEDSTACTTDRYFSYRMSSGVGGRHGALAALPAASTTAKEACHA